MTVITIKSDDEFKSQLSSTGKLVIVDFSAAWCPPCTRMAPIFEELAQKHSEVAVFLKVDIDDCQESAMAEDASTLPMFVFYKNGSAVDRVVGSKEELLIEKVEKLCKAEVPGDLNSYIIQTRCKILNESEGHPFFDCMKDDEKYFESKQGNQLIIFLKFSQPLMVHLIRVKAPESTGPKKLSFYVNQSLTMDFDKLSKKEPDQAIEVKPSDLKGDPIEVTLEKFKNVTDLQIFVQNNQNGSGVTRIDHFQVLGTTLVPKEIPQKGKESLGTTSANTKTSERSKVPVGAKKNTGETVEAPKNVNEPAKLSEAGKSSVTAGVVKLTLEAKKKEKK